MLNRSVVGKFIDLLEAGGEQDRKAELKGLSFDYRIGITAAKALIEKYLTLFIRKINNPRALAYYSQHQQELINEIVNLEFAKRLSRRIPLEKCQPDNPEICLYFPNLSDRNEFITYLHRLQPAATIPKPKGISLHHSFLDELMSKLKLNGLSATASQLAPWSDLLYPDSAVNIDLLDKLTKHAKNDLSDAEKTMQSQSSLLKYFKSHRAKIEEEMVFSQLACRLLKNYPLESINELRIRKFLDPDNAIKFMEYFSHYQIKHAYAVLSWQMPFIMQHEPYLKIEADKFNQLKRDDNLYHTIKIDDPEKKNNLLMNRAKKFTAGIAENFLAQQLINRIINIIETTHWKVGILGGEEVEINGNKSYLPKRIAEIYSECKKAVNTTSSLDSLNKIINIGSKASQSYISFFGLNKRDKQTQEFYDELKEANNSFPNRAYKQSI